MKLYTEEQIRQTFRNGFLYAMSNQLNEDAIVDSLTPIELPSDEKMQIGARDSYYPPDFLQGAKWMKEQILNQNK